MVRTDEITAYIDRLRHRAAVMVDSAAELRDEATDRQSRGAALDDLADALERIRDRTPVTVDAMIRFFTTDQVQGTEGDGPEGDAD
ncbi:MAG: hypothetical protein F4X69_15910 [Gemmatimonadetes bacterium]|nr:hypothetical protein [Gemmatimonadota bacterium]